MILYPPRRTTAVATITLPISKSLMARRLLLHPTSVCGQDIPSHYPADIKVLMQAIQDLEQGRTNINVGESGTAMRFLTAYIATKGECNTSIKLYGEGRQHERPISPLIDALRELGADVKYLDRCGYPPLEITPKRLRGKTIRLDASSSSQYLSALMLIAPHLEGEGYKIDTSRRPIASLPYAEMTRSCMQDWGYQWQEDRGVFSFIGGKPMDKQNLLEADWSAASYAYLWTALQDVTELRLPHLHLPSLQGDSLFLPKIFGHLGVQTSQTDGGITLHKATLESDYIEYNCNACPDIVPTIVAACLTLERGFRLTGVAHLRIKESDRLEVLRTEVSKLGIVLSIESDAISWSPKDTASLPTHTIALDPHGDHRMAMALAPLFAHRLGSVHLLQPEVVDKSFPSYWECLSELGYSLAP